MRTVLPINDVDIGHVTAKCPEIHALAVPNAGVAGLLVYLGREVINSFDFTVPGREPLTKHTKIKPFIRCALQRTVIQVETVNIGVNFQWREQQNKRADESPRWPLGPAGEAAGVVGP